MKLNFKTLSFLILVICIISPLGAMEMEKPANQQKPLKIANPLSVAIYNGTNQDLIIEGQQPIRLQPGETLIKRGDFNFIKEATGEAVVSLSIHSKATPITLNIEKEFYQGDLMLTVSAYFSEYKSLSKIIQLSPNTKFYNIIFHIKGNKADKFEGSELIVSASNQSLGE